MYVHTLCTVFPFPNYLAAYEYDWKSEAVVIICINYCILFLYEYVKSPD